MAADVTATPAQIKAQVSDMVGSLSTVALLNKENQLLKEISDLDSERQSLVYNHHYELVEASDTINRIQLKTSALSIDDAMDALRQSFDTITNLVTAIQPSTDSSKAHQTDRNTKQENRNSRTSTLAEKPRLPTVTEDESDSEGSDHPPSAILPEKVSSPSVLLSRVTSLIAIPVILRHLKSTDSTQAREFYESWEPALQRASNIPDVREIIDECKFILEES